MAIEPNMPVAAVGGNKAAPDPKAMPATGDFRHLLDSLEQLVAEHRAIDEVRDADQLQDAMRTADAGFVTAMDLRRQLEEAFRQRLP